jgi:hypothetical protein
LIFLNPVDASELFVAMETDSELMGETKWIILFQIDYLISDDIVKRFGELKHNIHEECDGFGRNFEFVLNKKPIGY